MTSNPTSYLPPVASTAGLPKKLGVSSLSIGGSGASIKPVSPSSSSSSSFKSSLRRLENNAEDSLKNSMAASSSSKTATTTTTASAPPVWAAARSALRPVNKPTTDSIDVKKSEATPPPPRNATDASKDDNGMVDTGSKSIINDGSDSNKKDTVSSGSNSPVTDVAVSTKVVEPATDANLPIVSDAAHDKLNEKVDLEKASLTSEHVSDENLPKVAVEGVDSTVGKEESAPKIVSVPVPTKPSNVKLVSSSSSLASSTVIGAFNAKKGEVSSNSTVESKGKPLMMINTKQASIASSSAPPSSSSNENSIVKNSPFFQRSNSGNNSSGSISVLMKKESPRASNSNIGNSFRSGGVSNNANESKVSPSKNKEEETKPINNGQQQDDAEKQNESSSESAVVAANIAEEKKTNEDGKGVPSSDVVANQSPSNNETSSEAANKEPSGEIGKTSPTLNSRLSSVVTTPPRAGPLSPLANNKPLSPNSIDSKDGSGLRKPSSPSAAIFKPASPPFRLPSPAPEATKVSSNTPLKPFSATSKPPPPAPNLTYMFIGGGNSNATTMKSNSFSSRSNTAAAAPPSLPSTRPKSFTLGAPALKLDGTTTGLSHANRLPSPRQTGDVQEKPTAKLSSPRSKEESPTANSSGVKRSLDSDQHPNEDLVTTSTSTSTQRLPARPVLLRPGWVNPTALEVQDDKKKDEGGGGGEKQFAMESSGSVKRGLDQKDEVQQQQQPNVESILEPIAKKKPSEDAALLTATKKEGSPPSALKSGRNSLLRRRASSDRRSSSATTVTSEGGVGASAGKTNISNSPSKMVTLVGINVTNKESARKSLSRFRGTSIDEDYDDYEGVEVPYEDYSSPVVPSGRKTPPPLPPSAETSSEQPTATKQEEAKEDVLLMPSGRSTPPPLPPVEKEEEVVVKSPQEDNESDWSESSSSSDSEADEDKNARLLKKKRALQHRSTQWRTAGTDLSDLLTNARLRTTTFPISENVVDFDLPIPSIENGEEGKKNDVTTILAAENAKNDEEEKPIQPIVSLGEGAEEIERSTTTTLNSKEQQQKEPPPLPQRPSKVLTTPTPLPPHPKTTSPRNAKPSLTLPVMIESADSKSSGPSVTSPTNASFSSKPANESTKAKSPQNAASVSASSSTSTSPKNKEDQTVFFGDVVLDKRVVSSRVGTNSTTILGERSTRSASSTIAPEHKAFLVDRLGYSPEKLIQLGPSPPDHPESPTGKSGVYLERWRTMFKKRSAHSTTLVSNTNSSSHASTSLSSNHLNMSTTKKVVSVLLDAVKLKLYSLPGYATNDKGDDDKVRRGSFTTTWRRMVSGSKAKFLDQSSIVTKKRFKTMRSGRWGLRSMTRGSTSTSTSPNVSTSTSNSTKEVVTMKKRGRGFDENWTSKKNPAQSGSNYELPKDLLEVMAAEEKLTGGGLPQAGKKDEIVKPMTEGVINSTIRWSKISHSDWL